MYFQFNNNPTSFSDAELSCKNSGGVLFAPRAGPLNQLISTSYHDLYSDSDQNGIWIGLSDQVQEGRYVIISGSNLSFQ